MTNFSFLFSVFVSIYSEHRFEANICLKMFRVVVCLILVHSIKADEVIRKQYLPLCENFPVKAYKLTDPGPCKSYNATQIVSPVDVYKPIGDTKTLKAIACRVKIEYHDCTYYFFLSKSCILKKVEYRPVDADTCKRAERNRVTRQGVLFPKTDKTLSSRNILKPVYSYPWTTVNKVENFILAFITVNKEISSKTFSHITLGTLRCKPEEKVCSADNWIIVYEEKIENSCKDPPKIKNTSLVLHTTANGVIYEIKQTNLISTILSKCDDKVTRCIPTKEGEKLLCFLSGHVIKINESANVSSTEGLLMNTSTKFKQLYAALATVANINLLNTQLLQRAFENALCKNARTSLVSLMGSQKFNPSKTLSFLLEREVNAVFSAGLLRELKCDMVEAYLQPSLNYKGRISDRPLFQAYVGLGTVMTSLRQGRFLSKHISNTVFTAKQKHFEFRDNVLLFENETLVNERPSIHRITIKNLNLKEKLFAINESEMAKDIELITNSEEENTKEQLKNLIYLTKKTYEAQGINIEPYLLEGQGFDFSFLTDIFTSVTSGIWGKTGNIIDILTKVYTIAISLLLITVIVQSVREGMSKVCGRRRAIQVET